MENKAWEIVTTCSPPLIGSAHFWWNTTGRHVAKMLSLAQYSDVLQFKILTFYLNTICNSLGGLPNKGDRYKSSLTADGSPIEYSFSYTQNISLPTFRFSYEPPSMNEPLSTFDIEGVVSTFASHYPHVDLTWFELLSGYFRLSPCSKTDTSTLITNAGHKSQIMLGFDFERSDLAPNSTNKELVVGKVYFLPCLAAIQRGVTRWQVVRDAIIHLVNVSNVPSILRPLNILEQHLARYPKEIEENVRYLATDLIDPQFARLKIYVRCPVNKFEEIWDFYTLGGQVKELEDSKQNIRDLYDLVFGVDEQETLREDADLSGAANGDNQVRSGPDPFQKTTICYFVLRPDKPIPQPKLFLRVQSRAKNDAVVAQGLDEWFKRQKWTNEETSLYEKDVRQIFDHRHLEDRAGLHSFVAISLKKGKLTLESYTSPELYDYPRVISRQKYNGHSVAQSTRKGVFSLNRFRKGERAF